MSKVPDLYYVVIPVPTRFCRAGHSVIFYRHDAKGERYVYDVQTFYGADGRKTYSDAKRYGAGIINRTQERIGLRDYRPPLGCEASLKALGIGPALELRNMEGSEE